MTNDELAEAEFAKSAPDAVALANKLHALLVQAEGVLADNICYLMPHKPQGQNHTYVCEKTRRTLTAIRNAGIGRK